MGGYGDGSLLVGVWAQMYEEWDPAVIELIADLLAAAWAWSDAEWSGYMSASAEEDERKQDAEDGFAFPHGSAGAHGGGGGGGAGVSTGSRKPPTSPR